MTNAISDIQREEWIRSQKNIMTWVAYGPRRGWAGSYEKMTGSDALSRFGMWGFLETYHTHFLNDADQFIGGTEADCTRERIRFDIDEAMRGIGASCERFSCAQCAETIGSIGK